MSVDSTIHESPRESECIDQDAILVFFYHEEAENPNDKHVDYISYYSGPIADSIYNLAHY